MHPAKKLELQFSLNQYLRWTTIYKICTEFELSWKHRFGTSLLLIILVFGCNVKEFIFVPLYKKPSVPKFTKIDVQYV